MGERFWDTLNLIVGWKKTVADARGEVDDWVNSVVSRNDVSCGEVVLQSGKSKSGRCTSRHVSTKIKEIKAFSKSLNLPSIECKFSHLHDHSRLEKLMGSNLVSVTDRAYMENLQQRILDDYAQNMNKRIAIRQEAELERVKNLVLLGKMPMDQAPPEMANHPVMLIEMYCNKLIAERRTNVKLQKIYIPNYLYWDDTPDPPSGLCVENEYIYRKNENGLYMPPDRYLTATAEEKLEYQFSEEELENMKYESPLIKDLRACETVEEMYALADMIIGALKTITEKKEDTMEDK